MRRQQVTNVSQIEEKIPFAIYMTPAVIEVDGTIHGQDIESFKEYGSAPPAYGNHKSDAIPAEWAEYLKQLSLSSQPECYQPETDSRPCIPIVQGSRNDEPPGY
jgi:hypothetical protein